MHGQRDSSGKFSLTASIGKQNTHISSDDKTTSLPLPGQQISQVSGQVVFENSRIESDRAHEMSSGNINYLDGTTENVMAGVDYNMNDYERPVYRSGHNSTETFPSFHSDNYHVVNPLQVLPSAHQTDHLEMSGHTNTQQQYSSSSKSMGEFSIKVESGLSDERTRYFTYRYDDSMGVLVPKL